MTVKNIKDYFKSQYGWIDAISIGKIDKDKEKAICFYDNNSASPKIGTVGGKANCSYLIKPVSVLLRCTKNADTAEIQANDIFNFFDEKEFIINGKRVFVISRYQLPVSLGTDENGVYEYSMFFDFYFEK